MAPGHAAASHTQSAAGQSPAVAPAALPEAQRLVLRQKPQPERGVHVAQVVLLAQASVGGGGGAPVQWVGNHDQSAVGQARLTGPALVPR